MGALGGGNVDISAGGNVRNLGVSIPNTGRVTGNTGPDDPTALFTTGGGDLSLRAGGNIAGGAYYVADGRGDHHRGWLVHRGQQLPGVGYSCRPAWAGRPATSTPICARSRITRTTSTRCCSRRAVISACRAAAT